MGADSDVMRWMYRKMLEIRYFEEAAIDTYRRRLWKGSLHACIGQEANAVGTAWLRLDLVPASAQPELRDLFRQEGVELG